MDVVALKRALAGHSTALATYVRKHIPPDLRATLAPEDVLQELWIAVFRNIGTFVPESPDSLRNWLFTSAKRKLIDMIRTERANKRGGHLPHRHLGTLTSSLYDIFQMHPAPAKTPSANVSLKEIRHELQIAVGALPENQRQALLSHYADGRSIAEIAETTEKSQSAVRSLIHRALKCIQIEFKSHSSRAARPGAGESA